MLRSTLLYLSNQPRVFRFVRKGGEPLSAHDGDLSMMFLRQVGLALENKEITTNREKFYLELVQQLADILDSKDASSQGQTDNKEDWHE